MTWEAVRWPLERAALSDAYVLTVHDGETETGSLVIWRMRRWHTKYGEGFAEANFERPAVSVASVEQEWRRRGVATALYLAGARWMAEFGLYLWASTTQSADAEALWASFVQRGLAVNDGGRLRMVAP